MIKRIILKYPLMQKYTVEESQYLLLLGRRIRNKRKAKSMTQQKIAAICDSEKSNLSRIESGQTNSTILTLKKIADAMQVPVEDILTVSIT